MFGLKFVPGKVFPRRAQKNFTDIKNQNAEMTIEITSSNNFVSIGSEQLRIWKGKLPSGLEVYVLVAAVGTDNTKDIKAFEKECFAAGLTKKTVVEKTQKN